jgi:hypothetical protein
MNAPQKSHAFAERIAQARQRWVCQDVVVHISWARKLWRVFRTNLGIGMALLLLLPWQYVRGDSVEFIAFIAFMGVTSVIIGLLDRQDRTIRAIIQGHHVDC